MRTAGVGRSARGEIQRRNTSFSVVPARISSQSSRHYWRSPLLHVSALIQRDLDVFLGYRRPRSFPTLPKLIWCGRWGCYLGQSLSNHGPHVFYRRKIRRASRPGKQFNLVIDKKTFGQCVPRVVAHYPVEIGASCPSLPSGLGHSHISTGLLY
ncbi:uncharacterized protein TNCV_345991 [Trichonephila clavipes]|nr:uncharacterized protein TNCV_345991 [Trichonephila clavipes]